ncbi:DUF5698 domain-containing protein [Antrihabitans sp. YC2-6]|uniref:DUF5698 domain-containing protein n=1 Tax=Antrihabitans sp. YC2-6 TaxID=2799498 RepID=UPI0018F5132A|nr:DUF5698 domain-containing protein [Antrihabitans sp. YC2-6]MBJ8348347.1 hypothetical protein [Antrihabitans sp. YC2-6]
MTRPEMLRPLVIMVLVLTEVALWQWRVILTSRGHKGVPATLGVLGSLLQVTAIAQVVTNLKDPLTVAAYAFGVGGGVLVGVFAGARFSTEAVEVKLVTTKPELGSALRLRGWPVIAYDGQGNSGAVQVLEIVVPGRRRAALLDDLEALAPGAFWTIEDLRPSVQTSATAELVGAPV